MVISNNLFRPIDDTFDHKLTFPIPAVLGDLKRFERIRKLEGMGEKGFQVDQSAGDEVDRKGTAHPSAKSQLKIGHQTSRQGRIAIQP